MILGRAQKGSILFAFVLLVFIVKVKEFAKVFRDLVCRKIAQDEQAREGGEVP